MRRTGFWVRRCTRLFVFSFPLSLLCSPHLSRAGMLTALVLVDFEQEDFSAHSNFCELACEFFPLPSARFGHPRF